MVVPEPGLIAWLVHPGTLTWPVLILQRGEKDDEWVMQRLGSGNGDCFCAQASQLRDFASNSYFAFGATEQARIPMANACVEALEHVRARGVRSQMVKFAEPEFLAFLQSLTTKDSGIHVRKRCRAWDESKEHQAKHHRAVCEVLVAEATQNVNSLKQSMEEAVRKLVEKRKELAHLTHKRMEVEKEIRRRKSEESSAEGLVKELNEKLKKELKELDLRVMNHRGSEAYMEILGVDCGAQVNGSPMKRPRNEASISSHHILTAPLAPPTVVEHRPPPPRPTIASNVTPTPTRSHVPLPVNEEAPPPPPPQVPQQPPASLPQRPPSPPLPQQPAPAPPQPPQPAPTREASKAVKESPKDSLVVIPRSYPGSLQSISATRETVVSDVTCDKPPLQAVGYTNPLPTPLKKKGRQLVVAGVLPATNPYRRAADDLGRRMLVYRGAAHSASGAFMADLKQFHETHNVGERFIVPASQGRTVDIYALLRTVLAWGGIEMVRRMRAMNKLCDEIGVETNSHTMLKNYYAKFLYPYEQAFVLGKMPVPVSMPVPVPVATVTVTSPTQKKSAQ